MKKIIISSFIAVSVFSCSDAVKSEKGDLVTKEGNSVKLYYLTVEGENGDEFFIITDDEYFQTIDELEKVFPFTHNTLAEGICIWDSVVTKELKEHFKYGYRL